MLRLRRAVCAAMEVVYVLQLEHGCWYVGKTAHLESRLAAHARGEGAEWTRLHPPLRPVRAHSAKPVTADAAAGEETRQTAKLMLEKGVNRVRGAELAEPREYTAADEERIVGLIGHHLDMDYDDVRECVQDQLPDDSGSSEEEEEDEEDEEYELVDGDQCFHCMRRGHWYADCPQRGGGGGGQAWQGAAPAAAQAGLPGACYICNQPGHWAPQCPIRGRVGSGANFAAAPATARGFGAAAGRGGPFRGGGDDACFRCGHTSHYASECSARWHKDGYRLD